MWQCAVKVLFFREKKSTVRTTNTIIENSVQQPQRRQRRTSIRLLDAGKTYARRIWKFWFVSCYVVVDPQRRDTSVRVSAADINTGNVNLRVEYSYALWHLRQRNWRVGRVCCFKMLAGPGRSSDRQTHQTTLLVSIAWWVPKDVHPAPVMFWTQTHAKLSLIRWRWRSGRWCPKHGELTSYISRHVSLSTL